MDGYIKTELKSEDFIIVISDEDAAVETPKPSKQIVKTKKSKQKRKVLVRNSKNNNVETLIITQKVQIKKQNLTCVINLNTDIFNNNCEIKSDGIKKEQNQQPSKIANKSLNYISRNLPVCSRKKCRTRNYKEKKHQKHNLQVKKEKNQVHHHHCKSENKRQSHIERPSSKQKKILKTKKADVEKSLKWNESEGALSLSPISVSPIASVNLDISYEDISLDSFTTCSESELDSLIKRSKERDRKIS